MEKLFNINSLDVMMAHNGWVGIRQNIGNAVVTVPLFPNGDLLLVLEHRLDHSGVPRLQWNFPRGGGNEGESAVDVAIRELKEETDITVVPASCKLVGLLRADHALTLTRIAVVTVEIPDTVLTHEGLEPEEGECIFRSKRFSEQEFFNLFLQGVSEDSLGLASYQLASINRRK